MLLSCDLDGTLVDSIGDLAAAAAELVAERGGRPPAVPDVARMVGDGAGILVWRVLQAGGLEPDDPAALARYLEIYDRRLLETTRAYDGIADVLAALPDDVRLAILTNKPTAPSVRILEALGLGRFFSEVVGGDGPYGRKPDPRGLLALATGEPQFVHLGDSPVDWETAQAAGCPFIWARYGFGAIRFVSPPDTPFVLEHPSDLPAVLGGSALRAAWGRAAEARS